MFLQRVLALFDTISLAALYTYTAFGVSHFFRDCGIRVDVDYLLSSISSMAGSNSWMQYVAI